MQNKTQVFVILLLSFYLSRKFSHWSPKIAINIFLCWSRPYGIKPGTKENVHCFKQRYPIPTSIKRSRKRVPQNGHACPICVDACSICGAGKWTCRFLFSRISIGSFQNRNYIFQRSAKQTCVIKKLRRERGRKRQSL